MLEVLFFLLNLIFPLNVHHRQAKSFRFVKMSLRWLQCVLVQKNKFGY